MATTYKVLGQSAPAAATATSLYTVPSATEAIISTINVVNVNSASDIIRIAVRPMVLHYLLNIILFMN